MREARQKWPSLTLCAVGCHLLERGSPTDSFAILEPKNPEIVELNVARKRRSTNFMAL